MDDGPWRGEDMAQRFGVGTRRRRAGWDIVELRGQKRHLMPGLAGGLTWLLPYDWDIEERRFVGQRGLGGLVADGVFDVVVTKPITQAGRCAPRTTVFLGC
jgi:hypothetical protein